jgi:hypothetical protein
MEAYKNRMASHNVKMIRSFVMSGLTVTIFLVICGKGAATCTKNGPKKETMHEKESVLIGNLKATGKLQFLGVLEEQAPLPPFLLPEVENKQYWEFTVDHKSSKCLRANESCPSMSRVDIVPFHNNIRRIYLNN